MPFHVIGNTDRPVSQTEYAGMSAGTVALYAYGKIEYVDVFDRHRYTQFCFIYGGAPGIHPQGIMAAYKYWNEAT